MYIFFFFEKNLNLLIWFVQIEYYLKIKYTWPAAYVEP